MPGGDLPAIRGAQPEAHEQAGGGRRRNPAGSGADSRHVERPARELARECEDTGGPGRRLEAARDLDLLRAQALGCEYGVGLGFGFTAQAVHEAGKIRVALAARCAIGQMLGNSWIDDDAVAVVQITVKQALFGQMLRAANHGAPPSSARSRRTARNRWTPTVDSFSPVMTATSRGVQSP